MRLVTQILSPIVGVTVFAQVVFASVAYWIISSDHAGSHVRNIRQMLSTMEKNLLREELEQSPETYLKTLRENFTTDETVLLLKQRGHVYVAGIAPDQSDGILFSLEKQRRAPEERGRERKLDIGGVGFHWDALKLTDDTELFFLESCVLYQSESNLGPRLLTTSIIIMWVAIWIGLILSHIISTRLKKKSHELEYQACHDKLTGLPNRLLFIRRLEAALQTYRRDKRPFALLLMDLDNFKELNDTLGHHYGDELLIKVGEKIRGSLSGEDLFARLGGDEFAAILHDTDLDGALICVNRLLSCMKTPHSIGDTLIESKASVGIAIFPFHADDAESLLQHADVAMYQAKKLRTGYAIYDSSFDSHSVHRLKLMNELRQSIKNDFIRVDYQPMICYEEKRVVSFEALARWRHPDLGEISPEEFIPVAEQTGLIRKLTLFVLNTALRDIKRWREMGYDINISMNISPHCLQDASFPNNLQSIVDSSGISENNIELEITETALMQDLHSAGQVLRRLHEAGYRLSIDDFGTGFSSLEHLKELPVDTLKIDKTFVMDMQKHRSDAAIVRSVTELGHNLNCQVIAEGVENKAIMDALVSLQVDIFQGYYFSEALDREAMDRWLAETGWLSGRRPLSRAAGGRPS